MINELKKEFDTMLPNFEEHLRKKYPLFVSIFVFFFITLKFNSVQNG